VTFKVFGLFIELLFQVKNLTPKSDEETNVSIFIPFSFIMQLLSLLLRTKYSECATIQRKE